MTIPTVDEVQAHERAHPTPASHQDMGGMWLVSDPENYLGPIPHITRLTVLGGQVMLQNGYSFWQPLTECKWAVRARYVPVDARGFPVSVSNNLDDDGNPV